MGVKEGSQSCRLIYYTLLKKYTETSLKRVGTLQTRMLS